MPSNNSFSGTNTLFSPPNNIICSKVPPTASPNRIHRNTTHAALGKTNPGQGAPQSKLPIRQSPGIQTANQGVAPKKTPDTWTNSGEEDCLAKAITITEQLCATREGSPVCGHYDPLTRIGRHSQKGGTKKKRDYLPVAIKDRYLPQQR